EVWLVRLAVRFVDGVHSDIVRGEAFHHVRACTNRIAEELVVSTFNFKDMLRIHETGAGTSKRREPERVRGAKVHLDRDVVNYFVVGDRLEGINVDRSVIRILYPIDGEANVVGGEWLAVAPRNIWQQGEGD